MKITEHLDLIDRLVVEQKPPAEIRGHLLAIREQIEMYEKEADNLIALKAENMELLAKLKIQDAEIAKLNSVCAESKKSVTFAKMVR